LTESDNNGTGEENLRISSSSDDRSTAAASGPEVTSQTKSATTARLRVLAPSDHITCLRQKNLRRRDDVIISGGHVMSNSVPKADADNKSVNEEW